VILRATLSMHRWNVRTNASVPPWSGLPSVAQRDGEPISLEAFKGEIRPWKSRSVLDQDELQAILGTYPLRSPQSDPAGLDAGSSHPPHCPSPNAQEETPRASCWSPSRTCRLPAAYLYRLTDDRPLARVELHHLQKFAVLR
jgi:hypothetical protein